MKQIQTKNAPPALGPYAQGVDTGDLVFCSGQIAFDNEGNFLGGTILEQFHQTMKNLQGVLKEADCSFNDVVKVDVFLKDMNDFVIMNEAYGEYFKEGSYPARVTVEVARLPKDALVEVCCVAKKK